MNDDAEDFFVEDVLNDLSRRKKRVNSKDKGKRGEGNLCKLLAQHFPDRKGFFRVIGSGNRWSHADLTDQAKEVFTGDVVCPEGFKFSVECKYGYKDIDLCMAFEGKCRELDEFLAKAQKDADRVGKKAMLCWKKPRMPWLAFVKRNNGADRFGLPCEMIYGEWSIVALAELLKLTWMFFD